MDGVSLGDKLGKTDGTKDGAVLGAKVGEQEGVSLGKDDVISFGCTKGNMDGV